MKIILGNLKMNFLYRDFCDYMSELETKYESEVPKVFLGIAVPYIYLEKAAFSLGKKLKIIAQDIHQSNSGAFTSAISAPQVASLSVDWSLIGHSECRSMNQNSEVIKKKVESAFINSLNVVYCCGADPLKEIKSELGGIDKKYLSQLIIAYEPIASIGTGEAMDAAKASETLIEIKKLLGEIWKEHGAKVKLLYGGSVNTENYKNYLEHPMIDGILVGGASLKIEQLWKMATLN